MFCKLNSFQGRKKYLHINVLNGLENSKQYACGAFTCHSLCVIYNFVSIKYETTKIINYKCPKRTWKLTFFHLRSNYFPIYNYHFHFASLFKVSLKRQESAYRCIEWFKKITRKIILVDPRPFVEMRNFREGYTNEVMNLSWVITIIL